MARTAGHAAAGDGEGEAATLGTAPVGAGVGVVLCGDEHDSVTDRRIARTLRTRVILRRAAP
jgi:hypothetical protein